MLKEGSSAVDFTLPDNNGNPVTLSDYKGKKIVLYFYPKDMTSGCTKQACAFAQSYEEFKKYMERYEKEQAAKPVSARWIMGRRPFRIKNTHPAPKVVPKKGSNIPRITSTGITIRPSRLFMMRFSSWGGRHSAFSFAGRVLTPRQK